MRDLPGEARSLMRERFFCALTRDRVSHIMSMSATQSNTPHPIPAEAAVAPKTVWWEDEAVCLIDQTRLPFETVVVRCTSVDAVAAAIRTMQVRGAPAIGVSAAYGLALAARLHPALCVSELQTEIERAARELGSTRPTAVNLQW